MASSKSQKRAFAELGSISDGTMRTGDLWSTFFDALAYYADRRRGIWETEGERNAVKELLGEIEKRWKDDDDYFDGEEAEWDLEALQEQLGAIAPPYCYFGANEGDGACFGFWVSWESLEEDARHGEDVLKIASGDQWPEDEIRERQEAGCAPSYVLEVNDHGNATLWTATARNNDAQEVWSVV